MSYSTGDNIPRDFIYNDFASFPRQNGVSKISRKLLRSTVLSFFILNVASRVTTQQLNKVSCFF